MDFWMDLGIAGFRMDAATMMFDRKGLVGTEVLNPGEIMERWNKHIKSRNPQGILLGEADVKIEKVPLFFGKGHRMDLLFNFLLNRYLFLAFAKNDATAIYKFMKKLPEPPEDAQWLDFLRNHDELNIEQLDEKDKKTVFKAFAPDDGMTVYGRGIRRRLAPMFNGNLKRLKMAYNLLFSLPGSQMLVYGDEIGMGEELQLSERSAVRIPMQWSSRENADFSDSHPSTLARSILSQGPFRYQVINVAEQEKDTASLLSHIKSLVDLIQNRAQIGFGSHSLVEHSSSEVFAIIYELEDTMVLILTNLSDKSISTDLSQHRYKIDEELFSDSSYAAVTGKQQITLNPFGYRWFLIKKS
jgi:maltose alpha-D-glucosyltransferase/alpha-amylase